MAVTAACCRNGQWLYLEDIEINFQLIAAMLKQKGVPSEINPIRCGTPGFELLVRDEDDNRCRCTAFHGGSQYSIFYLGRNQRFDVVTSDNIFKAILRRIR